ncbi:MAG: efflux RND transporter periplasmic adaptor subunit [Phycisphaerales bacterium]|nr:MAG: efflux RND transporter periplasmic adaptor subunit [Phycisphaerales bacterium]
MHAKGILLLMAGALFGLAAGAGGFYYAQTTGLFSAQRDDGHPVDSDDHDDESRAFARGYPEDEVREHTDGPAGQEGHEHDDEHRPIRLSPETIEEAGIEIAEAAGGRLHRSVSLPGEVVLNPDRLAHVVPRVGGIVREVTKTIGDAAEAGQVLAVLESRELAEAKAAFLAGKQRLTLAQASLSANEELKAKGIVPDLEFLAARRDLAEAQIELRAAEFKLHTLGVSQQGLLEIDRQSDEQFAFHELRAPFAGVVISRHITVGEVVTTESDVFEIADLGDVWVNLTVYQKELSTIRSGQTVRIVAGHDVGEATATIAYVSPVVDEATRTAVARVVLPNDDGRWRPGLFVTGHVRTEDASVAMLAAQTALQTIEDKVCVFVVTDAGFEPRQVELGRRNGTHVEIVAGLHPGERYVARGAFVLKAELGKESFGGEGHAH